MTSRRLRQVQLDRQARSAAAWQAVWDDMWEWHSPDVARWSPADEPEASAHTRAPEPESDAVGTCSEG